MSKVVLRAPVPFKGCRQGRICLGEMLLQASVQLHPIQLHPSDAGVTTEHKMSSLPLLYGKYFCFDLARGRVVVLPSGGREIWTKATFARSLPWLNLQ